MYSTKKTWTTIGYLLCQRWSLFIIKMSPSTSECILLFRCRWPLLYIQWEWPLWGSKLKPVNTLRPRQNGRHFPDDIFKWIFLNENIWISINISLKFVPRGPINNIPTLVQVMAWRRPGDKPLSEPMMVSLPTHICVIRPQWVNRTVLSQRTWNVGATLLCAHFNSFCVM